MCWKCDRTTGRRIDPRARAADGAWQELSKYGRTCGCAPSRAIRSARLHCGGEQLPLSRAIRFLVSAFRLHSVLVDSYEVPVRREDPREDCQHRRLVQQHTDIYGPRSRLIDAWSDEAQQGPHEGEQGYDDDEHTDETDDGGVASKHSLRRTRRHLIA